MATSARPVLAWVETLMDGTQVNASSYITATLHCTSGYEIQVPVKFTFSNVSADPIIYIYPSSDGGATFDSTAMYAFSVQYVVGGSRQNSIKLPTGQYALAILNAAHTTSTVQLLTQQVLTAYVAD